MSTAFVEALNSKPSDFKFVVLGKSGVGKTCIVQRWVKNDFPKFVEPTIEDLEWRELTIDSVAYNASIIDTAGMDEYSSFMRDIYYKTGDGFLLVYSVDNPKSLQPLKDYHEAIMLAKDLQQPSFPCLVIANKSDLISSGKYSTDEGKKFAAALGCEFLEVSALKNVNVESAFEIVGRKCLELKQQNNKKIAKKNPPKSPLTLQIPSPSRDPSTSPRSTPASARDKTPSPRASNQSLQPSPASPRGENSTAPPRKTSKNLTSPTSSSSSSTSSSSSLSPSTSSPLLQSDVTLSPTSPRKISKGKRGKEEEDINAHLTFKIAMLGDGGVGKSCVAVRFKSHHFVEIYDPTIENTFTAHTSDSSGRLVTLDIVDTSGSEDFTGLRDYYFRKCQGFCLVYAINSKASLASVKDIYQKIVAAKESEPFASVLVANKCDLSDDMWTVTSEQGKEAKDSLGIDCYFEVSAKTGTRVKQMFVGLVDHLVATFPPPKIKKESRCILL